MYTPNEEEWSPEATCAICGCEIKTCEICEDCAEIIALEGIDPFEEDDPYEEYGYDHEWELEEGL